MSIIDIINKFYESIRYGLKDITVFPGKQLRYPVYFAWLIAIITILLTLIDKFKFKHPAGAVLGAIILTLLYKGGENDRYEVCNEDVTPQQNTRKGSVPKERPDKQIQPGSDNQNDRTNYLEI